MWMSPLITRRFPRRRRQGQRDELVSSAATLIHLRFSPCYHSNAVKNTALVSEYLRICPGLSTLTMALSAWLTAEVQRWSSYTCIMMTLMYLQVSR